jgi:hypothetical protein
MKPATSLSLAGVSALVLAVSSPAMALNPQPLPPGIYLHGGAHGVSAYAFRVRPNWTKCRFAMCRS